MRGRNPLTDGIVFTQPKSGVQRHVTLVHCHDRPKLRDRKADVRQERHRIAMPRSDNALRHLATLLTMDFGVLVLLRYNFRTRRRIYIWATGPDINTVRTRAETYLSVLVNLDLANVEWACDATLLHAVNQPRNLRDAFDSNGIR